MLTANLTSKNTRSSVSFRESYCYVRGSGIVAFNTRRADRTSVRQPFSLCSPRTAALGWAAPLDASPRLRSFTQTWTLATPVRPTPHPKTPTTETRAWMAAEREPTGRTASGGGKPDPRSPSTPWRGSPRQRAARKSPGTAASSRSAWYHSW